MKLTEIIRYQEYLKLLFEGSYTSFTLHPDSQKALQQYIDKYDIKKPIDPKNLHVTLIASPDADLDLHIYPVKKTPIVLDHNTFRIKFRDFGSALVVVLENSELERQYKLAIASGAIPKFPVFKPHITLSYHADANMHLKGVDSEGNYKLPPPDFDIILIDEHVEEYSLGKMAALKNN